MSLSFILIVHFQGYLRQLSELVDRSIEGDMSNEIYVDIACVTGFCTVRHLKFNEHQKGNYSSSWKIGMSFCSFYFY